MITNRDQALSTLAESGPLLREPWRLEWPEAVQQAAYKLRLDAQCVDLPPVLGVVGGASSGKSTVFNNLIGGHEVSRVAARGHTTLGPILAVHEIQRPRVGPLLAGGVLLPGYRIFEIGLSEDTVGDTGGLAVVYHANDQLRDVLLLDTPDFTSEASAREGDRTLTMLPWFDGVLVVIDHERWFDRQAIAQFRPQSVRFGQRRVILFNRTREGVLQARDRDALQRQAELLALDAPPLARGTDVPGGPAGSCSEAAGPSMVVLEFRRGRGFCRFAPGMLERVFQFIQELPRSRGDQLFRFVAEAAHHAANQNDERRDRLEMLRSSLEAASVRLLPSVHDCMIGLMTDEERKRFTPVARVLRIPQGREWLVQRTLRIQRMLKRLPVLGTYVSAPLADADANSVASSDRRAIARAHYQAMTNRQRQEIRRLVRSSVFWHEITRWTGHEPADPQSLAGADYSERDSSSNTGPYSNSDDRRIALNDRFESEVDRLDAAIKQWAARVEKELEGFSPHATGAIGAGALVLAVVLVAVPGPVSALTFVAAKGAIGGALTQLAAATGAGALFGRQIGAFAGLIREKLLGSSEFDEVRRAAASYRALIESDGRRAVDAALQDASRLVLGSHEPLARALEALRDTREQSQ